MAEKQPGSGRHSVNIINRERLTATGIRRVDSFSDTLITAQTELGQLNLKGEGLRVESLSSETGDMLVLGKVIAMSYTEAGPALSLLGRIFK